MWFESWSAIGRIAVTCVIGYAAIVLLVRASGKRSLSKMNAFDFVINVALGSMLATIVLSDRIALASGLAALASLFSLQYMASWLAARSSNVRAVLRAEPALVFHRCEFQPRTLRRERLTEDEVHAAIRQQGVASLELVESVILETNGDLSVVVREQGAGRLEGAV